MSSDLYRPDLEAYFSRIGYTARPSVDLATLHALTAHHVAAIPFENLDVVFGRGISIDPEKVEQKLVFEKRGGYCFEQNQLLYLVLAALGFEVTLVSARVRWLLPRDVIPPRTHVFIRVRLAEGDWITDVGVGSCSLGAALRWEADTVQSTPHDERRLIREGDVWFHQTRLDGEWLDVCEFTGDEMPLIDREIANWWTSTNPESKFRRDLFAARADLDGGRRGLLNANFAHRVPGQPTVKRCVETYDELRDLLATEFSIELPVGPRPDLPALAHLR